MTNSFFINEFCDEFCDNVDPPSFTNYNANNNLNFSLECNNNFAIIHLNIRSLRKNFDSLLAYLSSLQNIPNLIFVSEIWIYDFEKDNFNINSDFKFFASCNNNYAAGGVGVFVKNGLDCNISYDSFKSADIIKVICDIDGVNYCFVCIYRLHECSINSFLCDFSCYLRQLKCKNCIILGDMNIDLFSSSIDVDEYKLLMATWGFQSLINEPTRITPHTNSCIDHIFSRSQNNNSLHLLSFTYDIRITDHIITGLIFKHLTTSNVKNDKYFFSQHIDHAKLSAALYLEFWEDVYLQHDPSLAFELFLQILSRHVSNWSTNSKHIVKKCHKIKPWITSSLLRKINKRNKLSKIVKHHANNSRLGNHYSLLCKKIKNDVKICKENYYTKKFDHCKGNSKKEWQVVNNLLNKGISSNSYVLEIDNCKISDPGIIANHFNNFFANMHMFFPADTTNNSGIVIEEQMHNESFVFNPITASELHAIINGLKNSNSRTSDVISVNDLKKISFYLVDVLAHIFNRSICTGKFPDLLKVAIVIPLLKKGSSLDSNNYRPISLLSVFSKIFEKAVKSRILYFLNKRYFFIYRGCLTEILW